MMRMIVVYGSDDDIELAKGQQENDGSSPAGVILHKADDRLREISQRGSALAQKNRRRINRYTRTVIVAYTGR